MKIPFPLRFGVLLAALCLFPLASFAAEAARTSTEALEAKLGQENVVVIDVRATSDWKSSDEKIKGAVRENPNQSKDWAARYDKGKEYVLYCS